MAAQREIADSLSSSLDLNASLQQVYPQLLRLADADAAALAVFTPDSPGAARWLVTNIPHSFFAGYPEMVEHDFVRTSITARPNQVLLDQEMIGRRALDRHPLYQRAREVGANLEQVIAVLLPTGAGMHSAIALYRDRRRAFDHCDRMALQGMAKPLSNAVRNCTAHQALQRRLNAHSLLTETEHSASILVSWPGDELARTRSATRVIDDWFSSEERGLGGLPQPLRGWLQSSTGSSGAFAAPPPPWERRNGDHLLIATFLSVADRVPCGWLVALEVRLRPRWSETLTPQERRVLAAVCEGWDNALVSQHCGCSIETTKKHLASILQKSGKDNRGALIASKFDL